LYITIYGIYFAHTHTHIQTEREREGFVDGTTLAYQPLCNRVNSYRAILHTHALVDGTPLAFGATTCIWHVFCTHTHTHTHTFFDGTPLAFRSLCIHVTTYGSIFHTHGFVDGTP